MGGARLSWVLAGCGLLGLACGQGHEVPKLVAHRGDSMFAPENTIEAFASADLKTADVLETDVFMSADGEVMCIHDTTVTRTTDQIGRVDSFTAEELNRMDAGYRFTSDGGATFPYRGRGIFVPTLRQAMEALPHAVFNIDMKEGEPAAVPLSRLIDELGAQDRVLVATTRPDGGGMDTSRALQPMVRMVATVGESAGFAALYALGLADSHEPVGVEYQLPVITGISDAPDFIEAANRLGQAVQHWTINNPEEMRRLLLVGSDGVMTDDVAMGAEVFAPFRPPSAHRLLIDLEAAVGKGAARGAAADVDRGVL